MDETMALTVMAGLVPAIHVVQWRRRSGSEHAQPESSPRQESRTAWMAGTSPAMTENGVIING